MSLREKSAFRFSYELDHPLLITRVGFSGSKIEIDRKWFKRNRDPAPVETQPSVVVIRFAKCPSQKSKNRQSLLRKNAGGMRD